ncbi:MAG: HAD family hydrolase [Planctomycetota bacterium]|nr:HAD family hydrolase [Planctomycetota bacterium]MDA1262383.1 HAD family hydrolase [Planctomycetota bacterium]
MGCKILVTDLDGTLLDRSGSVSFANRQAIALAKDSGIEVVFATGRSWLECRSISQDVLGTGVVISAGGAALHDIESGRCEDRIVISQDLVSHCTESLIRHGHLAHLLKDSTQSGYDYLLVGDAQLDAASRWWFGVHPVITRSVAKLHDDAIERSVQLEHVLRVGTVAMASELSIVADAIRKEVPEQLTIKHWPALVALGTAGIDTHLLEIFDTNVDKWAMIQRLCKLRGVDEKDVVTIGDGLNDVGMLSGAANSFAVANADSSVAQRATHRAPDHDESAFAFVVAEVLRKR